MDPYFSKYRKEVFSIDISLINQLLHVLGPMLFEIIWDILKIKTIVTLYINVTKISTPLTLIKNKIKKNTRHMQIAK